MRGYYAPLLILLVLIALPWVITDSYYQHLLILVLLWVAIGSGWNLIAGYTGQVSFGHAAFFGVAAYTSALLGVKVGISPWWGMLFGGLVSVALAFPVGYICFRLRGAYFALATLALGELLRLIATVWESLTGGMVGVLTMLTFVSKVPYYYVALAIAVFSVVTVQIVVRSRWGYYFVSIRENQDTAESIGINTRKYKMISLCLSAYMTGLAGSFYTNYMGFIDPEIVFSLHDISIMAILVGIVGGVATVYGPPVGALIMVAISEVFRTGGFGLLEKLTAATGSSFVAVLTTYVKAAHVLSFGLLVILVILYLPNGIVGDWNKIKRAVFLGK
jgi:branched-chain amino acid transport system permease protein